MESTTHATVYPEAMQNEEEFTAWLLGRVGVGSSGVTLSKAFNGGSMFNADLSKMPSPSYSDPGDPQLGYGRYGLYE